MLRATVLIRVILIGTLAPLIVLLVQVLRVLLGLMLRLLLVEPVLTLGLSQLVDFGARKPCEQFLREGMGNGLAWAKILALAASAK